MTDKVETQMQNLTNSDTIKQLNELLLSYNLTPNQTKVFLFLSTNGTKTASEVSKTLKIPRTETYHLLNSLMKRGVVNSSFGKPTRFHGIEMEKSIELLLKTERNKIKELESKKQEVIELWKSLPKNESISEEIEENKFQTLQGKNSIITKIEQMVRFAKNEVLVYGTEQDFMKFNNTDFAVYFKRCKSEVKILTDSNDKTAHIFNELSPEIIRKINSKNKEKYCFIIKDNEEVIFFIDNLGFAETIAIWTNSNSFVSILHSLFSLIWKKSPKLNSSKIEEVLQGVSYDHRLKEIEQEKMILNYLQKAIQNPKGEKLT